MKCLNISDKRIKALADEFGEVATSLAIDKWESLGNKDLPEREHMVHLEQLIVDVDSGKNAEEAHELFRSAIRKESSLKSKEKRSVDIAIDKVISDFKKGVEAIEEDKALDKESQQEEIAKLSESFVKENAKMLIGDGETKADAFKEKLRETYTGIKAFDNDFETEKMLVDIATNNDFIDGKPFEADFEKSIDKLYDDGISENDKRKIELAKRLGTLKDGELVSLFSFFHSSQNLPYLKFLWNKSSQLKVELSNSGFEQNLIKQVSEKLSEISDAEYAKMYAQQKIKPVKFDLDAAYLEKLTGIPVSTWETFVNAPSFNPKYKESILRNFIVFRNHEASTKKAFINILTKAKEAKKGSVINTIALNTPIEERAKQILPRFKNTVWNLKSSAELDSSLINRIDNINSEVKNEYYKDNEWAQMWKDKKPQQANVDGFYSGATEKMQEAGKLSSKDLRRTVVESYKSNLLSGDTYLQVAGQFGDKDKLYLVEAKKYEDVKDLRQRYGKLLMKQGVTKEEAKKVIDAIVKDSIQYQDFFNMNKAAEAELFALNYAYNFNMINDYINGDVAQYGKKGKDGKWKTAPVIDLFKRNGSTASPGMYGNKYVEGGLKEGFKYAVINAPKINGFTALDGQSFITREHSDKVNKSFGTIFDFNTSIKAITSFVNPNGKRYLDKTNSIVIDELAKQFPNSFYASLFKFMKENNLSKVSTVDGAKFKGEAEVVNYFKEGTAEINPEVNFSEKNAIDVKTEDYLVQQDLVNDGEMYEASTPIQRTKNMIHDENAEIIAKLFNEVGEKKLNEMSDKILNTDKETWRKYILGKVGFSKEEIENLSSEELSSQEFSDLDAIEKLLATGVSLTHPHINVWLSRYIANIITKQALGRVTNKALAVEMAYLESSDFKLRDYREEDGKIFMPESAVPYNSGLRAPSGNFPNLKSAIARIKNNPDRYRDMYDEHGNIREYEIEVSKDGKAVIPGELHLITRIPADNMHSHTLARVKYLLPEGMKNVIITNHQTQEIAGSDFDGDQRTIESFFKDRNDNVHIDGNSKHALANKALHLQMQWYYNAGNIKTALEPIDVKHYDKYLQELPKESSRTKDSPETFVDARKKNNVGLAVVGIMANLQSAYDFLRKHNSFIKTFTDTKKDKEGNIISSTEKDWLRFPVIKLKAGKLSLQSHKVVKKIIDSDHIKNAIGNLLNLSLDNVKDPKIERLGLNEVTVKMYVPAMMTGMDEESVIAFFNTPTVKRFVEEVRSTGDVDSTEDLNAVFKKMAEEKGEEWINAKNDGELTQADLESPLSFSILRKLRIMTAMGFDYDKIHSVIRLTEQAPKSWVDFKIAQENYEYVKNNYLTYLDTTEFNNSPFIKAAENALKVSEEYFQRFGNEQTPVAQNLFETLEQNIQLPEQDKYVPFNREQMTAFSKGINSMMLMMSRGKTQRFKKWKNDLIKTFTEAKEKKRYPEITAALEVQDNKISIREDLKRNPIDPKEERDIHEAFNKLLKSDKAEDIRFAMDLMDYAVFQYELSPSTARGSYSALFSPEMHKQIGEEMQEVYDQFYEGGFSKEWMRKLATALYKANPIFIEQRSRDNGKKVQRIYEPFATDSYEVKIGDKNVFELLAKGVKGTLKLKTNGENSEFAKNAEVGDVVQVINGEDTITLTVSEIIPDPNLTEVKFEMPKQKTPKVKYSSVEDLLKSIGAKKVSKGLFNLEGQYYYVNLGTSPNSFHISFSNNSVFIYDKDGEEIYIGQYNEKTKVITRNPNFLKEEGNQKQKSSVSDDAYNESVIDILKQAIPQARVLMDERVNSAGELDEDGKTIRINPNYARLDTPIHEFGHILVDALGGTGSSFIRKGIEQLRYTELWKETKKRYPELNNDMFAKEVLTEAIGREGAAIFKDQEKKSTFRKWLDVLFFRLRVKLGLERNVAKQLAMQLLSGRKLNLKVKSGAIIQKQKIKSEDIVKAIEEVGKKIEFDEETHVYSFGDQGLVPTTQKIDNIEEYRYTGHDSDDYDINSELGRGMHKVLEDIVNGKTKEEIAKKQGFTKDIAVFDSIYEGLSKLVKRIKKDGKVMSEVRIGNLNNSVAGTIDILVVREDGSVDIYDLKTSIRSTEDKKLYRNRYNNKKASKQDKHGLQMATYAKMLEMGDEELGLPSVKINTLTIVPIHIAISGKKVVSATMEDEIGFGYSNYSDKTFYTLPEQTVESENKEMDEQEAKLYQTRYHNAKAYGEAKYGDKYDYLGGTQRLKDIQKEMTETEYSNELSEAERSKKMKDLQREFDRITHKAQKIKEEYEQYLKDFDKIIEIYKEKNVSTMSFDELIALYNTLSGFDSEAVKQLINSTKVAIAKQMMAMRTAELVKKNPTLNPENFSKEDLKASDVWMKALSDFTEAHPEMQEFADRYFHTYEKMLESKQKMIKDMETAGKAVVAEYHKKHGIASKIGSYLNPLANNQKYFSFMETEDGRMVQTGSAEYNALSPAQKQLVKTINNYRDIFKEQITQGGKKFDREELIKVERTFAENFEKDGLFSALAKYAGSDNFKQRNALLKNEAGKFETFGDIEQSILQKVRDKKISKISGLVEIKKYKKRAEAVINRKLHENGDTYDVNEHAEFELNASGQIKSKFHHAKSKRMKYSKDFYRASMEMFSEMNFIKHMNEMIPLVESIEAYSKSMGDDRKNLSKYIDIWKRGNILKEDMQGMFGKKVDKWVKFFRNLTHLRVMAFNIPAAIFNIIIGKYNQFRGDSIKHLGKGEKRFWADWKKTQAVLTKYQATSIEDDTNPAGHISNIFAMLAYGGTRLGEKWIQGGGVIGQLTDEEWSWLDEDGTVNDKGLEKLDGEEYNKAFKARQTYMTSKMNEYKKKVRDIQGKYSDEDKRNFSHFELGRAAMQFKVWMPDALRDRFSGKYIDLNGNERQGTMNRAIFHGLEDLKALIKDPKLFTSNEPEWKLHRRTLRSALAFGSAMGLFFAGGDDEEDKWFAKQLSKVMNDMATGFSFDSAEFTLKNPVAMLGTASHAVETIEAAFMFQTYKNNGSVYGDKGEWKAPGMVVDMMPYKNVSKLVAEAVGDEE